MKIGLLAYSTSTGLGHQTLDFYRFMKPHKTLVADLSRFNGMEQHPDWFPDAKVVRGIPDCDAMSWLTDDVDVVFVAETPLNYCLFEKARQKGVVTIQQYNYEFLDYTAKPQLAKPDILAAPSAWNTDIVESLNIAKVVDWPVPINRETVGFREIKKLRTFVHIIGRPAVNDRNGTLTFLEAARKIGRRFNYKVYYQEPIDPRAIGYFAPIKRALNKAKQEIDIEIVANTPKYRTMYESGEVLVLPRRYGGLCLPMQEALAAGMPVIMTDISPNNVALPKEWLVAAKKVDQFTPRMEVDIYEADPSFLAFKMLEFENEQFMQDANHKANEIAERLSWKNQAQQYTDKINQACAK